MAANNGMVEDIEVKESLFMLFMLIMKPFGKFRRMFLWVCLTLAMGGLALLIMWGVNSWDPLEGASVSPSIWEVFFAVFGLMYAIIAGLFLVESCRRRSELSSIIYGEVNAIGDIHDCLGYFGDHGRNPRVKKDIIEELLNYVKLMKKDWKTMKDPEKRVKTGEGGKKKSEKDYRLKLFNDAGFRPVIEHICQLEARSEGEKHALGLICDRVCEVTTYRVNRRELAQHGLAAGLYLLIPFMSLVIFAATLLLPVANSWLHGFIVFSTAVALFSLFLLLLDSDHPFIGLFGIRKDILDDIKEKLNRPLNAQEA